MQFRLGVTLVAVLAVCLAATAEAQQERGQRGQRGGFGFGGFGGGFGGGTSRLALLSNEAVQKELGLSEEQVTAIREVQRELGGGRGFGGDRGRRGGAEGQRRGGEGRGRGRPDGDRTSLEGTGQYFVQQDQQPGRRGGFQPSPEQLEEFRRRAEERAKQEREKLAEILLPNQLKRLNQIYLQVAGVNALNDSEVAKELEITDEQREKMATVRQENAQAMGEQMRELFQSGGEREQIQAKMAEIRKANDEKVLAVLTDEQKKKFEEMKGEKFAQIEELTRGGGFGGFGGRGGPGGAPGRRGGGERGQRGDNP